MEIKAYLLIDLSKKFILMNYNDRNMPKKGWNKERINWKIACLFDVNPINHVR
jgi:hypothetical protein